VPKVPTLQLNDRVIDGIKEPGMYWDCAVKAFGVRVGKSAKTFIVVKNGGRRISLGRYPATSLRDARKAALEYIPVPEAALSSQTLLDAKKTYEAVYLVPTYRERSAYNARRLLALTDPLDAKDIREITSHDITAIMDALRPSQANHLFGVLRTFFGWCERRDYIAASPIRKLTKPHKEKDRKRTLSDAELKAIWNACEDDSFGKIVRLLMLTGQRRGEVAAIESGWIADTAITFPPHITKNGEEHTIPLATSSATLLGTQLPEQTEDRRTTPSSFLLFPSSKTGTIITGWAKLKEALDKRSGVKNWTLHDLRRTFSTKCAELGVAPHIIERCLNHLTGSISPLARRYNQHQYQAEMRAAFDLWDAHITRLISPQSSP
jgi:integrase